MSVTRCRGCEVGLPAYDGWHVGAAECVVVDLAGMYMATLMCGHRLVACLEWEAEKPGEEPTGA